MQRQMQRAGSQVCIFRVKPFLLLVRSRRCSTVVCLSACPVCLKPPSACFPVDSIRGRLSRPLFSLPSPLVLHFLFSGATTKSVAQAASMAALHENAVCGTVNK
ncbi:hypothetical protein LY76DRAFT_287099 [Colletotrichum caudatum]|nr:hypothetical protein LY76DRAFT_287099 [Colletotrichum caudatum]